MAKTTLLPLPPHQLHHPCDPASFSFETTSELNDLTEILGQMRAMDAIRFATGMRHDGYNLFVLGPAGMGKHAIVKQFLEKAAHDQPEPSDWCYVNDFQRPHKPRALKLPSGRGAELGRSMEQLVDYLTSALPALFEGEEYRSKAGAIQEELTKRQEHAFTELNKAAEAQQIVLLRTPEGFAFAPTRNGEAIPPEEYEKLADHERERVATAIAELQQRLEKVLRQIPQWRRERHERIKQLDRDTTLSAVAHSVDELKQTYQGLPEVLKYFDLVQQDMVDNGDDFRKQEEQPAIGPAGFTKGQSLHRYQANVLVTNGQKAGAPIVSEDSPTYSNLVGRVEHLAQFGALVTDFTLIKPGALHRANGGYLLARRPQGAARSRLPGKA